MIYAEIGEPSEDPASRLVRQEYDWIVKRMR